MAAYVGRGIHGQVVEALGYRIVSGRIAQGDTIDVRSVAEEMDISLTVMRESLKVLMRQGAHRLPSEARHLRPAGPRVELPRRRRDPLAGRGRPRCEVAR